MFDDAHLWRGVGVVDAGAFGIDDLPGLVRMRRLGCFAGLVFARIGLDVLQGMLCLLHLGDRGDRGDRGTGQNFSMLI